MKGTNKEMNKKINLNKIIKRFVGIVTKTLIPGTF